jgi:hypothetical protein
MAKFFLLSNLLVLPFWILMILAPHWGWTRRIMRARWAPMIPAAAFVVLLVPEIDDLLSLFMRPDLAILAGILEKPQGAIVAWLHFLAFDLFVGRWAYLDGRERGIPALIMSPVLTLVMLLGPVGYVAHMGVRALHEAGGKKWESKST